MHDEVLTRLQAAQTVEERTLIVTMDLIEHLDPPLRAAAWAAAVPHWFDGPILAALLEIPAPEAESLYLSLQDLSFVEPIKDLGHNVHELTRRVMISDWWNTQRDEYRNLSLKASRYFAEEQDERWQVESIYHLLIADEGEATYTLGALGDEWCNSFRIDPLYLLVHSAMEHVEAGRVGNYSHGWILFFKGCLELYYSGPIQAKVIFEQALVLTGAEKRLLRGHLALSLGDVHLMLSELKEARACYEKALSIFEEIGNLMGQAEASMGLGNTSKVLDGNDEAMKWLEKALSLYRSFGSRLGVANACDNLGDVHMRLSEYEAARKSYEDAFSIYGEVGNLIGLANSLRNLGKLAIVQARYDEARGLVNQSLEICHSIGDTYGEACSEVDLALLEATLRRSAVAADFLKSAIARLESIGATGIAAAVRECLERFDPEPECMDTGLQEMLLAVCPRLPAKQTLM